MAGTATPTTLVDPRNVPVPLTPDAEMYGPDAEMHGPPTAEQSAYIDARSLHLYQQNVEISNAGEVQAAANAVRLAAELRFREYEDSARNIVTSEMQELRQIADARHEGMIVALTSRFNQFADGMRTELGSTKAELRATQDMLQRRQSENAMQERHTEHLINRLVEMSERSDAKDEEMLAMKGAFETNRSETISFLTGKFSDALAQHQAEHRRVVTLEEVEFDSLIQDLSEQNAELQRRLGEAIRSSGRANESKPEDSFPQGTAPSANAVFGPASLRTDFMGKATPELPDPFQIPEEMKDLLAGPKVYPLSPGNSTPREDRAVSSKDVPGTGANTSSPETLLIKALQSMVGKGDDDGKPKAKEAESIKLLEFPTPDTYRSWRIAAREAIRAASDRPDEAFAWVQAVYAKDQTLEGLSNPGKFLTLDTKLLSAISKIVKGELARQIVNYKESEAAHARAVRGRQVLYMFEQYFKTNEEVGALYSVEDLLKVSLINDDLSSFIHNWESVIAGISHVPEELTLRDILLRQIRGSRKLKYDLDTYDRAKEGSETHSYQFLLSSIKNLLTRERVRKNRDKIAKAHGAKYGAPASEEGKGKGKGGRKGRSASRQRESSQVPKGYCFAWVKSGKCEKGADCKYKHEKPRGESPNRGRTNSPKKDLSKIPCKFHKIGRCTEGANCRFSHSKPASPAKGDKQRAPSPAKRRRSQSRKKKGDKPAACCVLVARVDQEAAREGEPNSNAKTKYAAAARKGEPSSSDCWEHKAKEGVLIRHHATPRSEGFVPTKDSPVPASRLNAKAVVVMNLDQEGRTSIEKTWDWRSGKLNTGFGDNVQWTGSTTFKIQNKNKKKKVSFLNKPEIKEIPAEGEGWKHIPSASSKQFRYRTAQDCPKVDPNEIAIAQSVAENLHIAVLNQLNGYVPKCKYKCKNDSGVCKHCCVDPLNEAHQQASAPACPASTPLEVIADTGSEEDLISKYNRRVYFPKVQETKAQDPVYLQTANGPILADKVAKVNSPELGSDLSLFTLGDSPTVCSVGRKCLEQGFGFYWPPGEAPYFIRPDGTRVGCRLRGRVPVFGKDMFASAGPAIGESDGASQHYAPTLVKPVFRK